jgi:hypothetical protein
MDNHQSGGLPSRHLGRRWFFGIVVAGLVVCLASFCFQQFNNRDSEPVPGESLGRLQNGFQAALKSSGVLPAQAGESWSQMDNAAQDGWDSEAFNAEAAEVLKQLAGQLNNPDGLSVEHIRTIVHPSFSCEELVPISLQTVHEDDSIQILRFTREVKTVALEKRDPYRGPNGFLRALQHLTESIGSDEGVRFEFKTIRVSRNGSETSTRQMIAVSGRSQERFVEQHAIWDIRWRRNASGSSPKLAWIGVQEFEQITNKASNRTLFSDCTKSVLERNGSYREQFLVGMNKWLNLRSMKVLGNPALAIGDVNGDGIDDLYVCQEEGLPNRLFVQNRDGTATDVSDEWQVNWLHNSRGALFVDLDNDGDQDLAVSILGHVVIASNEGGRFKVVAVIPTDDDTTSLCAADYDNDGDLDLYVCVYEETSRDETARRTQIQGLATGDGGSSGGRNSLIRNDFSEAKSWRFTDVTEETGLNVQNRMRSLAASWEDYDNDGDQDLYVANDAGRNNLYRNDNGRFVDVAESTGSRDNAFGMSVTWGDYNLDGWMDVYVSNMFSSAGNRITFQEQFLRNDRELRELRQRFVRGNTLLKSEQNGKFVDVSNDAGVTAGRWAWSSNFADINNDGRPDLIVANGYITTQDTGDL